MSSNFLETDKTFLKVDIEKVIKKALDCSNALCIKGLIKLD